MKYTQYVGIILGALYGLVYRFLCENLIFANIFEFSIYSISFVWILPIVVAILPLIFAQKELMQNQYKRFLFPILSVLLFFLFALASRLEDLLCIAIIAFPFLFVAGFVGLVAGFMVENINAKKLYSLVLLPFLISPMEVYLPNVKETFGVQSSIVIDAPIAEVWGILVEVPEIQDQEYEYGVLNYMGVPRPLKSNLEIIDGTEYRVGYFTEGLKLYESIAEYDSLHFVNFNIHMEKSELRDVPTDKHLLNNAYFSFQNISYRTVPLQNGKTQLTLSCDYTINSKMNGYANFWAKKIIGDFEIRLLAVLKKKITG